MLSYSKISSKYWRFFLCNAYYLLQYPLFFKRFNKSCKSTFSKTGAKLKYYVWNKTFFSPERPDYQ